MSRLGAGGALRLGGTAAVSLWRPGVLVFLLRAAEALVGVCFAAGWLAPFNEVTRAVWLTGLAIAWLSSGLLRVLILAAALRQGRARMLGQPVGALVGEGAAIAPRAVPFAVLWFLAELFARAWIWIGLGASGVGYVAALLDRTKSLAAPSLSLALALIASPLLAVAAQLWCEVAFARSVRRDEPAGRALFSAAGDLSRRLGAPLLIWIATALAAFVYQLAISGIAGAATSAWAERAPQLAVLGVHAIAAVVAAYLPALLEVTRLQAFAALDLDATGELPRPSSPAVPAAALPLPSA